MVMRRMPLLAATAACLLALAGSAGADDALDALQVRITGIAGAARAAVVSIEDFRALAGDQGRQEILTFVQKVADDQVRSANAQLGALKRDLLAAKTESKRSAVRAQIAEVEKLLAAVRQTLPIRLKQVTLVQTAPKSGTGFHIGGGYIVTTADVVEGMQLPVVEVADGRRATARVVGVDPEMNVGLLRANAAVVTASLTWADSTSVAPGNLTVAVGNQRGETGSVSLALIGSVRRTGTFAGTRFYPQALEFVGTMGPGASGAPLLNTRGEVVAMVAAVPTMRQVAAPTTLTMKGAEQRESAGERQQAAVAVRPFVSGTLESAGLMASWSGLAIPSNHLQTVVGDLRTGKPPRRSWLGIAPAEQVHVTEREGMVTVQRRIIVAGVFQSSPADRAGLRSGDVLTHINGNLVDGSLGLRGLLIGLRPGERARLTIERKGATLTCDVSMDARPSEINQPLVTAPR